MNCPHCKKKIKDSEIVDQKIKSRVSVIKNGQKLKMKRLRRRWNKNVNVYIGGTHVPKFVQEKLFNSERFDDNSVTLAYKDDVWLTAVMRDAGIYSSTSEAAGAGWKKKAEPGFQDHFLIVKRRACRVTIYKEKKDKVIPNS